MIHYYDIHNLIIWAHIARDKIQKRYSKYINPISIKLVKSSETPSKLSNKPPSKSSNKPPSKSQQESTSGVINMLKNNINKSNPAWISTGMVQEYDDRLKDMNKLFDGIHRKSSVGKVRADLLPVGHVLAKIPRFYMPDEGGWIDEPAYGESMTKYKENNIIIGYDERAPTGISVKFKIRRPFQSRAKSSDARLFEKGSICATNNKIYLKEIARKLNINLDLYATQPKKRSRLEAIPINTDNLCDAIRTELIYRELKERMAGSNIKWFYFIYENQVAL